jgi:hypothetical protein
MEKVLNRSILSTWREEFATHVQAAGSIRIQWRNMTREPPPRDGPSCNDRDNASDALGLYLGPG